MAWKRGLTAAGVAVCSVCSTAQTSIAVERVRALDPTLRRGFERGTSDSSTFRRLVSRLERSDVIVHLTRGTCPGRRVVGCITSVSAHGGVRYVRIDFVLVRFGENTALHQSEERLAAQIGHELQHVLEIADEPSIVDAAALERMYSRKKAYRTSAGFETDAAIEAGAQVLKELEASKTARRASRR